MATDTIEKWKNPYSAEGYNTLCVWEGTLVEHGQEAGIEKFFLDEFKVHIKYVDKFLTLPGKGGPGGRSDVLFALLDSEMTKFAKKDDVDILYKQARMFQGLETSERN